MEYLYQTLEDTKTLKSLALDDTKNVLYCACIERGKGYKLIRNIKPTKIKLTYDTITSDRDQKISVYYCLHDYFLIENLETKQSINLFGNSNNSESLHIFDTLEEVIFYYNDTLDDIAYSYEQDQIYLTKQIDHLRTLKYIDNENV